MNDLQNIVQIFARAEPAQKANGLALLIHELTIQGRAFVLDLPSEAALHKLRGINELQHKISSQLSAYLSERTARYPDDIFWKSLTEVSAKFDLASQFVDSASAALSHIRTIA